MPIQFVFEDQLNEGLASHIQPLHLLTYCPPFCGYKSCDLIQMKAYQLCAPIMDTTLTLDIIYDLLRF